jgi:hypothetical protein
MSKRQLKDNGTRVVGMLSTGKPCVRCYHFGTMCVMCTKYNNSKITICTWKTFQSKNGWFSLTYQQYIEKCNKNSSILTIYDEDDDSDGDSECSESDSEKEDGECSESEKKDGECSDSEKEDGECSEKEDGECSDSD